MALRWKRPVTSAAASPTCSCSNIWRYFRKSSILIVTQEDLFNRRQDTLRDVFRFLGVDDTFVSTEFAGLVHESGARNGEEPVRDGPGKGPERGILRRLPLAVRPPAEKLVGAIVTSNVNVERPR